MIIGGVDVALGGGGLVGGSIVGGVEVALVGGSLIVGGVDVALVGGGLIIGGVDVALVVRDAIFVVAGMDETVLAGCASTAVEFRADSHCQLAPVTRVNNPIIARGAMDCFTTFFIMRLHIRPLARLSTLPLPSVPLPILPT